MQAGIHGRTNVSDANDWLRPDGFFQWMSADGGGRAHPLNLSLPRDLRPDAARLGAAGDGFDDAV